MFVFLKGSQRLVFLLCLLNAAKRSSANGVFTLSAKGHRLEGSLLKETKAASAIECLHQCLREDPRCKSVNYGVTSEAKGKCQLNNATVLDKYNSKKLVVDKDFHYFERVMRGRPSFCHDPPKKYNKTTKGYRLNTTAYKEVHASSGTDCAVHCVHDHCCRSVNYRKDPVYNGKENCELLQTVASEQPENLKPDQTYDYYLLLEPERSFDCNCSGCENNGTCQGRSNCSCLAGFSGKRCEKDIDECVTNPCHENAKCENTIGSFTCTCNYGFSGDGTNCIADITGYVTFDDYGVIEADGVTVKEKRTDWKESISFTLPANTTLVILEGENGPGGPGGVVASFSNGVVTDESWECTDGALVNFTAWPMAVTYGQNSEAPKPWKKVIEPISGSAQWIWTSSKNETIVHCRKSFDMDECITSPCYQDTICYNTLGSYKCTCRHGEMVNGINCEDSLYLSKILGGDGKYLKQLYQWLNNETKWKLCYRASEHGWGAKDFHSNCDGKGQTVTIVRVGDYIFGGYSDVDWRGLNGNRTSSKAFLFSLRNKDNLPPFKSPIRSTRTAYAIYPGAGFGPRFGKMVFGGGHDLNIDPNSHTSTTSHSNLGYTYQLPPGYSYGTLKTQQLLAGSHHFRTSEIEVYYMY